MFVISCLLSRVCYGLYTYVIATYLDAIVASHRQGAKAENRSLESLISDASELEPCRGFRAGLADPDLSIISEIKRRSPSKGDLNANLDPASLARSYADGGAACLSVLTDVDYFGGSPEDLRMARRAVDLPVIRKDFTVSPFDVVDARLMGADAVLLIVAVLDDHELKDFHDLATELGMDVLVETHDEAEVERALAVDASLIGVNQRDLVTFEVDTDRAVRVAGVLPEGVVRVAESGVTGPADATRLREAGYHALLVGEALVRSGDPVLALTELRSA